MQLGLETVPERPDRVILLVGDGVGAAHWTANLSLMVDCEFWERAKSARAGAADEDLGEAVARDVGEVHREGVAAPRDLAALLEACEYCDDPANHDTLINTLSRPELEDKAVRLGTYRGGATEPEMRAVIRRAWGLAQAPTVQSNIPVVDAIELATLLVGFALAVALPVVNGLFVVPLVTESSIWTGNRVNHPELAYAVLASAVLGFGWSVIYTAMSLRMRRSK